MRGENAVATTDNEIQQDFRDELYKKLERMAAEHDAGYNE